ncbi:MAG: hypothetical protein BWZ11_01373 [Bacteroidetes bacterium ADurb.BinA395]|nr:MAG: hypothetical protein BWZ11_01373 [Bacteroidetes bacterium ADurb.BinA395]
MKKYILNQGDMFQLSLPFIPESKKAQMILAGLLTCSRI